MTPQTAYPHIEVTKEGLAVIKGTTTKVVEIVEEKNIYGVSPEELHLWHPYLSLAQIHAALTYYWDHKKELDGEIAELNRTAEDWMREREEEHRAFESRILAKSQTGGVL